VTYYAGLIISHPIVEVSVAEEEVIVKEVQAVLAVTLWYHTVPQSTCEVRRITELAVTAVVFTTFVPATSTAVQAVEAAALSSSLIPQIAFMSHPVIRLTEMLSRLVTRQSFDGVNAGQVVAVAFMM